MVEKIFFITGMGRSGSKFLSNLLNKCEETIVLHEPLNEVSQHLKAFSDQNISLNYIKNIRKKEVLKRAEGFKVYGEVNSYLRNHVPALKEIFPNAKFIHLVRDGRDVVKSICNRSTFLLGDKSTIGVEPKGGWKNQTRFKKICWYWNESVTRLNKQIPNFINFEKVVLDWDYFKTNVLDFLTVRINKKTWEKLRGIRVNSSISSKPKWDNKKMSIFNRMCGESMRRFGYYD